MPSDRVSASLLMSRTSISERLCFETQEIFKRLLRAHLNLEQAHEYIRERFSKTLQNEGWRLEDIFELVDNQQKNTISIYDIEKLIIEHKKCGSRTLMEEVELLMQMYDRGGANRINFFDFKD